MKEYFQMSVKKRAAVIGKTRKVLEGEKGIVFACVFGSFLDAPSFKDIDVGVYLDNIKSPDIFDKELEISKKLADKNGLSFDMFDVKVLNFAPRSFLTNVFKNGKLLFSKNQTLTCDVIERVSLESIANEYVSYQSLKDLVPA